MSKEEVKLGVTEVDTEKDKDKVILDMQYLDEHVEIKGEASEDDIVEAISSMLQIICELIISYEYTFLTNFKSKRLERSIIRLMKKTIKKGKKHLNE